MPGRSECGLHYRLPLHLLPGQQEKVKEIIKENRLKPGRRSGMLAPHHEPLFQETLKDCGLNKYLFEMANIRRPGLLGHQKEPGPATAKAKDLVRMAWPGPHFSSS